ncbi:MAG: putative bifunctional diguanylate cyclase/phosphodiesterase [Actinomycetales bacterium]
MSAPNEPHRQGASSKQSLGALVGMLPSPSVVVGTDGRVVAVNDAWLALAAARLAPPATVGPGADYLGITRAGATEDATPSGRAAAASAHELLLDVLSGRRTRGHLYYDCPSPHPFLNGEEWLLVVETLVVADGERLALVTHHGPEVLAGQVDERASQGLLLRKLGESGYDLTSVSDADGRVRWVSPGVTPMLGWQVEDVVGRSSLDFLHPDDLPLVAMRLAVDSTTAGRHDPVRFRFRHADGSYRWLEGMANNLLDDPTVAGMVVNARDITASVEAEQRLAENEQWQRSILESLSEAVVVADETGCITQVNGAAVALFGYPDEASLVGLPTSRLMPHDLALRHERALHRYVETGSTTLSLRRDLPLLALRRDGTTVPIELTLGEVRASTGRVFTATIRDVSDRLALTRRLEDAALRDPLTAIGNRRMLVSCLEQALGRVGEELAGVAVVYLDLDDFTTVNEARGQHVGDEVLTVVAQRLEEVAHEFGGDDLRVLAGRMSGDDFVLVVEVVTDDLPVAAVLKPLTDGLRDALDPPVRVEHVEVLLQVAVGIAVADAEVSTSDALLHGAQAAMRAARGDGGGQPRYYDEDLRHRERRALADLAALRQALGAGEFELHYQAISHVGVDEAADSHPHSHARAYAAEALLRWRRPGVGLVSPGAVIPLLESSGLILEVGAWVLRQAVRDAATWGEREWPDGAPTLVSVNVSPRQLSADGFVQLVEEALATEGLPPSRLVLEVTEEMVVTARGVTVLQSLRELGVRIAIDDFGTGHSSLAYLASLPADILKLDRAFVAHVPTRAVDVAVLGAVAALGAAVGLRVVVEGVETLEQLEAATTAGIDCVQGYLLDRPHPLRDGRGRPPAQRERRSTSVRGSADTAAAARLRA